MIWVSYLDRLTNLQRRQFDAWLMSEGLLDVIERDERLVTVGYENGTATLKFERSPDEDYRRVTIPVSCAPPMSEREEAAHPEGCAAPYRSR